MALGAALLLGALVFLFVKTAGIDFRHDSQALNLMREMITLDSHWDDETGRLVNDLQGTTRVSDFSAMIGRTLGEAERGVTRDALRGEIGGLRRALDEKAAVFKALRESHARSVATAQAFGEDLANLDRLASARSNARPGNRPLTGVAALAQQLRGDIARRIETFAARSAAMEQRLALMRQEAAVDPTMGEAVNAADASGHAFLQARAAEDRLWNKLTFLTLGGRIDLVARSLSKSIEATLDEKDRW
ncbi:MAG TPA: hypothetical protein VHP55_00605, partial [Usitatibacter sp.]|nr:hypothetical protein [Usitatibacter sp.]